MEFDGDVTVMDSVGRRRAFSWHRGMISFFYSSSATLPPLARQRSPLPRLSSDQRPSAEFTPLRRFSASRPPTLTRYLAYFN